MSILPSNASLSLSLTPSYTLGAVFEEPDRLTDVFFKIFQTDWRAGLFHLAADNTDCTGAPVLGFWKNVAARYLTELCHLDGEPSPVAVPPPSDEWTAQTLMAAPPMPGGEYLGPQALRSIHTALDTWVRERVDEFEGLSCFLQQRAPKWNRVGRVCFHLAENKADPERPFAFMATYIPGLGASGKARHLPLRKALEEYSGTRNRTALVKLLTPVQQAAQNCAWVSEMIESKAIYQPQAWTARQAYDFLRTVPQLEESGLWVRVPDWWKKRPQPTVSVNIETRKKSLLGVDGMLSFKVDAALGDETLSRQELEQLLSGEDGLVLLKGQWVEVNRDRLRQAVEHWDRLEREYGADGISFVQGMRLLAGASLQLGKDDLGEEARAWTQVRAGAELRKVLEGLRDPAGLAPVETDTDFKGTLRPYQREGLAWMHLLTGMGLGACLADDMGLGKTIQVLALVTCRKGNAMAHGPSLLVVPASLLGNWKSEAAGFAPTLRLKFFHASEMSRSDMEEILINPKIGLDGVDLLVTTYAMVARRREFADIEWDLVILDEAQAIKNSGTGQSRAVRRLTGRSRIGLTGTPVENRLGDLWSLFDFLNPGLLGSAAVFKKFVNALQERDQYAPLRKLVAPYILRRLKTDKSVIADLPDKTELRQTCHLTPAQIKLYEQVVRRLKKSLSEATAENRRGVVLESLLRLKQVCNHPSQLTGDQEFKPQAAGKFSRLTEICSELAQRQEKVLIFTQFREIIPPLAEHLATIFGREGTVLHGGTSIKERNKLVDDFQKECGPPFFILSLKAGGTGLNLTAASHVIHFDRWWNPAVENQATDRAFRIGQKKNVLVHKFVTAGSIEERIDALIRDKQRLADAVMTGAGEMKLTELSDDELLELVRLDVTRARV